MPRSGAKRTGYCRPTELTVISLSVTMLTFSAGATPAASTLLRANGSAGWFGWPDDPELESLRAEWFDAPDLTAQRAIAGRMQRRAFETVPFVPLGQYFQATAYRNTLSDVIPNFATFWSLKKAA